MEMIESMDVPTGMRIDEACKSALELATEKQVTVIFSFNGARVAVSPDDTLDDAFKQWRDEFQRIKEIESVMDKARAMDIEREREKNVKKIEEKLRDLYSRELRELFWRELYGLDNPTEIMKRFDRAVAVNKEG